MYRQFVNMKSKLILNYKASLPSSQQQFNLGIHNWKRAKLVYAQKQNRYQRSYWSGPKGFARKVLLDSRQVWKAVFNINRSSWLTKCFLQSCQVSIMYHIIWSILYGLYHMMFRGEYFRTDFISKIGLVALTLKLCIVFEQLKVTFMTVIIVLAMIWKD